MKIVLVSGTISASIYMLLLAFADYAGAKSTSHLIHERALVLSDNGLKSGGAGKLIRNALHTNKNGYESKEAYDALKASMLAYADQQQNDAAKGPRKGINRSNQRIDAYLASARAFLLSDQRLEAFQTLNEGIEANPNSAELWFMIGNLQILAGRDAEALSVFKEIIRLDKKQSMAHHLAANVLLQSNKKKVHNVQQALPFSQAAVALEPKNADYLDTLAEIWYQLGNKEQALATIDRAIKISPEEPFFERQRAKFSALRENEN